ncbi:hypothetical protein V2G26_007267 [Clonostachys chloroleuca]
MAPTRPTSRHGFEIAIICALTIEADAVEAIFDQYWDDGYSFGKASGDPNAYTTGSISYHNVVLAHMPGMGKINAAVVVARPAIPTSNWLLSSVYVVLCPLYRIPPPKLSSVISL